MYLKMRNFDEKLTKISELKYLNFDQAFRIEYQKFLK